MRSRFPGDEGILVVAGTRCRPGVAQLLDFAGGVRQMLPVLGLDGSTEGDLADVADDLHAEASSPAPDRSRLRQLVKRLLAGLNNAAPTVAKTMLLAAGEAAQKAITGG
jgi:hypothetical protein